MILPKKMPTILIVDDKKINRSLLKRYLIHAGYKRIFEAENGEQALEMAREVKPDLILLDIVMPGMSGYEVCRILKRDPKLKNIPIIFLSVLMDVEDKVRAFEEGGVDYITKPFEFEEVRARVQAHLRLFYLQRELERYNKYLETMVEEKVREIYDAQMATIYAIARLAEKRDYETGQHLERTREYCRLLAEWLLRHSRYKAFIDEKFIKVLYEASPLHDIGKVGVPDAVLLKPGRLTPEEFEIIKTHTIIGAQTLEEVREKYPENAFISMGIEIARSHHEKWNGSGYPDGLKGDEIPLSARIMALADVYDALRSQRPYKEAYSHEKSREIIVAEKGKHFDPLLVEAFLAVEKDFAAVHDY
ncbi:MAG: two-component system response regulator [Clostridia bacterium]|nr:two-component system response regulator [Clostridia bacterium]